MRHGVILATVGAAHGIADLVHGAQVKNKALFLFEDFVANLANHLNIQR